jgi:hypothetical protein
MLYIRKNTAECGFEAISRAFPAILLFFVHLIEEQNTLQGREYWNPLSDVFLDYIDHPEAKFEGDVGVLKRRHLKPNGCEYIGKEANKIVMQEFESNRVEMYPDIEKIRKFVLDLTPAKAREIGIKYRKTLNNNLKKRMKEGDFNLNTKEMRKIIRAMK